MASGATITVTALDDGVNRIDRGRRPPRVVVDGRPFPVGEPVKNVSKDTIERLQATPGVRLKIEPAPGDNDK